MKTPVRTSDLKDNTLTVRTDHDHLDGFERTWVQAVQRRWEHAINCLRSAPAVLQRYRHEQMVRDMPATSSWEMRLLNTHQIVSYRTWVVDDSCPRNRVLLFQNTEGRDCLMYIGLDTQLLDAWARTLVRVGASLVYGSGHSTCKPGFIVGRPGQLWIVGDEPLIDTIQVDDPSRYLVKYEGSDMWQRLDQVCVM